MGRAWPRSTGRAASASGWWNCSQARVASGSTGWMDQAPDTASRRLWSRGAAATADAARGFGESQIGRRSEEHTSELQSLMRISYAVFCLKKKKKSQHKKMDQTTERHV